MNKRGIPAETRITSGYDNEGAVVRSRAFAIFTREDGDERADAADRRPLGQRQDDYD